MSPQLLCATVNAIELVSDVVLMVPKNAEAEFGAALQRPCSNQAGDFPISRPASATP